MRKRWNGSGGSTSFTYPSLTGPAPTSYARPLIRTSPPAIPVPSPGLACSAKRGSRSRSRAFCESGIMPSHSPPSWNRTSRPERRGEPSWRTVARTWCRKAPKRSCAVRARAGSAAVKSAQFIPAECAAQSRHLLSHFSSARHLYGTALPFCADRR
ncbi:hypothetical protein SGPA1_12419 [Streptomyces misionensis JCM 4497]